MADSNHTTNTDITDPDAYVARHDVYAQRRESAAVVSDDDGRWTVLGHAAVTDVLRDIDTFVGAIGGGGAPDEQILQWIPEPKHSQIRRALVGVTAPNRLDWLEAYVRGIARDLVGAAVATRRVDIIDALATPVPTQTLAALFGVPATDATMFQRMSDQLLERQANVSAGTPLAEIHPEFAAYAETLVAARRQRLADRDSRGQGPREDDRDDIVSALLEFTFEGQRLSDAAVRAQLMMLIIAGSETTRNLLGNVLATLADHPSLYERLRTDPGLIDGVVDESLRRDSPIQLLMRTCSRPVELDGAAINRADTAIVCLAAANRDPAVFADAAAFDADRPNVRQHLAFGTGPHVCPGAGLARMEGRVVLQELIAAVDSISPVRDRAVVHQAVFWAHGPRSLWVDLASC
ncbi:MAG TPA: cytochrome P450 [Ilumatobacteraceae bacterium]